MQSDFLKEVYSNEPCKIDMPLLESILMLAVDIAREGREGRRIGTMFVVGDSARVLAHSRPLILDPLYGHPDEKKCVTDPEVRESLKELAQLDGAFVVSNQGVVLSAARYIDAALEGVRLPLGLGSRHLAAAAITARTESVAIVVSESAVVRIFDQGRLLREIIPEFWMLRQFGGQFFHQMMSEREEKHLAALNRNPH